MLHEVIHGPALLNGADLSIRMLCRVAALKLEFPDQVHVLLSNHELAQVKGEGILKDGHSVVESFDEGLDYLFGEGAGAVADALESYVRSLALAVRCANGVLCSHSLPSPRKLDVFDTGVLGRELAEADYGDNGAAYLMVWGRHHNEKLEADLAGAWSVDQFVMGHQPTEMGYETEGQRMIVLASDHDHGVALPIDLGRRYDQAALVEAIHPLAAVRVDGKA